MLKFFREMKARRMNKIVDEVRQQLIEEMSSVTIEAKRELESFVIHKTNDVTIDYDELVRLVDYSDIAYHIDTQDLADEINTDDIAYNIDLYEVANNIDASEVAEHFDHYTLAQEIDLSDIAEYIDLDDIRQEVQETKDEIISEVEGMISDAVDNLEITRG